MATKTLAEQAKGNVRQFHLARIGATTTDEEYYDAAHAYLRAVVKRLPAQRREVGQWLIERANKITREIR